MRLTVLVERVDEQTYRAQTAQPVPLSTEGRTHAEAVERLRELARQRLATGRIVRVEVPATSAEAHPWAAFAGIWKDHPEFDAFLECIANNRRRLDDSEPEE